MIQLDDFVDFSRSTVSCTQPRETYRCKHWKIDNNQFSVTVYSIQIHIQTQVLPSAILTHNVYFIGTILSWECLNSFPSIISIPCVQLWFSLDNYAQVFPSVLIVFKINIFMFICKFYWYLCFRTVMYSNLLAQQVNLNILNFYWMHASMILPWKVRILLLF